MYLTWRNNAKELIIYVQELQQPSRRVKDCLKINNSKSYKATKVEPKEQMKVLRGLANFFCRCWVSSCYPHLQAMHPKRVQSKWSCDKEMMQMIPTKYEKNDAYKHEKEMPKLFLMKWMIAPCIKGLQQWFVKGPRRNRMFVHNRSTEWHCQCY